MPRNRIDVFFYGLFMDEDLLRAKGLRPQGAELAFLPGYALRIGQRATLVPDRNASVHGVVLSLTAAELELLYEEASVREYKPHKVVAHLVNGGTLAALCYLLPDAPPGGESNAEYASKLQVVAERVGLPPAYVSSMRAGT